jgi:tetratricopeptide (TPR) repeat protein
MSYFAMSEFERVPEHLRFVLASIASGAQATHEDRGLQAVAELWLAKTYRKLGKFLEAEAHAREAVSAAKQLDAERAALTLGVADPVDDYRWPLWVVVALAHMQLAGCHADRGGKLEHAARSLTDAREIFARLEKHVGMNPRETDTYANYEAERGRLLLAQDRPDEAITALTDSTDIDPDEADVYLDEADVYLLLARARTRALPSGR